MPAQYKSTTAEGQRSTGNIFSTNCQVMKTEQAKLTSLINSMHWTGTAGPTFVNAHTQWDTQMGNLTGQLDDMAQRLHSGAGDAEATEGQTNKQAAFF
jgi:DNA-binding ferritin-like protein